LGWPQDLPIVTMCSTCRFEVSELRLKCSNCGGLETESFLDRSWVLPDPNGTANLMMGEKSVITEIANRRTIGRHTGEAMRSDDLYAILQRCPWRNNRSPRLEAEGAKHIPYVRILVDGLGMVVTLELNDRIDDFFAKMSDLNSLWQDHEYYYGNGEFSQRDTKESILEAELASKSRVEDYYSEIWPEYQQLLADISEFIPEESGEGGLCGVLQGLSP